MFHELNLNPDEELMRLVCRDRQPGKSGLNLFDPPGYNSLTPGHQEILESFLAHSDVILFTCNYRVGFNQSDQELLTRIKELVDVDDTPIFLVLNRAPSGRDLNDKRAQEIKRRAEDCVRSSLTALNLLRLEDRAWALSKDICLRQRVGSVGSLKLRKYNQLLLNLFIAALGDQLTPEKVRQVSEQSYQTGLLAA